MRFACPCYVRLVPGVEVAFVDDTQTFGHESLGQFFFYAGLKGHVFVQLLVKKGVPTKPATFPFVNSCCRAAAAS
jgi:hypothetical protein